jgi:transcriptional regulator with XRE-family HTH domain
LEQTKPRTALARWRVKRGVTQSEMAAATGLSRTTYIKLEHGRFENPPIRYLANCALALGCEIDDLIETQWREWLAFDEADAPRPPDQRVLWRER